MRFNVKSQMVKTFIFALTAPLWVGCTTIVNTKGEQPSGEKVETTAIKGWDKPGNMRELGETNTPKPGFFARLFNNGAEPAVNTYAQSDQAMPSGPQTDMPDMYAAPAPMMESPYFDSPNAPQYEDNQPDMIPHQEANICPPGSVPFLQSPQAQQFARTKIRVSGYGAPPAKYYSDQQRRLLAIRAAKVDAIRALSERVTGIEIWANTTLTDLALDKDRLQIYMDSYIQGARLISINQMDDTSYEAVMELKLDKNFVRGLGISECVPGSAA